MFGLFRKKKKKKETVKPEVKPVETKEEVVEEPVEEPVVEETVVEEPAVETTEEPVEEPTEEPEVEEKPEEAEEKTAPKRKRKAICHVTRHKDGGWQLKKEGASRAIKRFETQKEAIEYAKDYEKRTGTSYIIHKVDGSTRKKTY